MKLGQLKSENARILNQCAVERNKQARRRLLMTKLENENKISELKGMLKSVNDKHFKDLRKLREMRERVDQLQREYDNCVSQFKSKIGMDEDSLGNLMVSIYNKYVVG